MMESELAQPNQAKSLFQTVLAGGTVSMVGSMVIKVIVTITTIVVLRYVAVYDFGLWQLVLGVIGFTTLLSLPGIEELIINDISRELGAKQEQSAKSLFVQSSATIISLGILSGVVMYTSAPVIWLVANVDFSDVVRVLAWFFPLYAVQRVYSLAFYSHYKFLYVQYLTVLSRLGYFVLILAGIFWWGTGLMALVYAYTFSVLVSILVMLPAFLRTTGYMLKVPSNDKALFAGVLRTHGKWALASNYFDNLAGSVRPWIIGYFLGIEPLAIVSVAISLFGELSSIIPLNSVLTPIMPRHVEDEEKFKKMYVQGAKYAIWLYTLIALVAIAVAPFVVDILFPRYIQSLPYFRVLLISLPLVPFTAIVTRVFFTHRAQKELFFAGLLPRVASLLVFLPVSVRVFGAYGVVIERVLSSSLITFTRTRAMLRVVPFLRSFTARSLFKFDEDDRNNLRRLGSILFR